MTDIEILEVLIKAKELGLTMRDVEAFKNPSHKTLVPDLKAEEIVKPMSAFEDFSEDRIKYWATPYYDELVAKEEAMKKNKENGGLGNG